MFIKKEFRIDNICILYSMSARFPGCGKISKIFDPSTDHLEEYLIHNFYPTSEPQPEMTELNDSQQKCLMAWANKFHITPISKIKKNKKDTEILKRLLHIGRKKIEQHITPVKSSMLQRGYSFETGISSNTRSSTISPVHISQATIRRGKSEEEGFSSVPNREPTVDEILEDPWVYFDWQLSNGRVRGGSTRRKKSRGRKTRRH
jgi:hypothetical protein